MKIMKWLVVLGFMVMLISPAFAVKGILSTEEDINRLKQDLMDGQIQVGSVRLNNFRDAYGEATGITQSDKKISYDYGDLKINFKIERYWKEWSYDTFKSAVYTDDVDKLRKDLESLQLIGDNITSLKIVKDYGLPTESTLTNEDGAQSAYYYGDIKLVFENVITIQDWTGKNLNVTSKEDILGSKPKPPAKAEKPSKAEQPAKTEPVKAEPPAAKVEQPASADQPVTPTETKKAQ